MPENHAADVRSHAIWSGVITFGLVSVPVALLPGQRSGRISLRMFAPDGTPLRRRYYCSQDDRPLDKEDIVRGYEVEKGEYVIVDDDELDALAPNKSKEIDLRRFVPADQIDPVFFDRAYFLSPLGDTVKPYRLLAAAMEASGRAGIATFVMRGKEYLVAILSEKGILRAETLRFAGDIRSADDIGLGEPVRPPEDLLRTMSEEIKSAAASDFDKEALIDPSKRRLQQLIEEKIRQGKGMKPAAEPAAGEDEGKVIDLMEILKRSIGLASPGARTADFPRETRQALYEQAKELDIPGRSSMSKEELSRAIHEKRQARQMNRRG